MDFLNKLTVARALIVGVFFAALYYYFVYDDGDTLVKSIQAAKTEIATQTKQIKDLGEKLDRAHDYQRSAAEMGEALNRLLSYIPEDFRPQDFMKVVSEEAKIAGLNIIKIDEAHSNTAVSDKEKKPEFDELIVTVDLQGTFAQQMTFLANLTKRKQIFIVDRFQLNRETRGGAESEFPILSFRADIKAYRYIGGRPKS